MVNRFSCFDSSEYMDQDEDGKWILYEDHEKLRLLLAEVIIRFSAFDGDFMTRLVDTLEEG